MIALLDIVFSFVSLTPARHRSGDMTHRHVYRDESGTA